MYRFNLEALLQHRKFIEESKQKDLSLVQLEFDQEQKCLSILLKKQIDLADEFRIRQNSSMQPQEIVMYRTYTSRLINEIDIQQKKVQESEKKVNIARDQLLSATKDRKIMETLKEKKKKEFIQKVNKREQILINEAAVIRFNRNSK